MTHDMERRCIRDATAWAHDHWRHGEPMPAPVVYVPLELGEDERAEYRTRFSAAAAYAWARLEAL